MDESGRRLREVYGHIDAIVQVLAEVLDGDYDARLAVAVPDTDPLHALHLRVNELIAARTAERERSVRFQGDIEELSTTIELQRAALRTMSTPIIEVWSGVLCLPVIGVMEPARSAQMMTEVLEAVESKKAGHIIIDVTGVDVMDSSTLNQFVAMANAVRLLGAECVLTGIGPVVAQTLVQMQFDGRGITTLRSLREALTRVLGRR